MWILSKFLKGWTRTKHCLETLSIWKYYNGMKLKAQNFDKKKAKSI